MTTQDLLARAIGAARAEAETGADDGAATRLRIRESLAKRGSKRRLWTLLAAALGTMFASTAFALQAGWEPPWSSRTEAVVPPSPDPDPPATPDSRRGDRVGAETRGPSTSVRFESMPPSPTAGTSQALAGEAPLPAPPAVADPAPTVPSATAMSSAAAEPPGTPRRTAVSTTVRSAASRAIEPVPSPAIDPATPRAGAPPRGSVAAPADPQAPRGIDAPPSPGGEPATPRVGEPVKAPVADAELAAYRTAHALHFRGTDPAAALAAWDALLARFPSGRLAPEARFNRALTLIKLSRWADARAALAPFASGGYRQNEAKQLLDAIAGR